MTRDVATRDDGTTVDVIKQEAEQAEITSKAKRVIEVDALGDITDANLVKFDPNDANPDYIGTNSNADASDDDEDWLVRKITYSGSNIIVIKKKKGSWTGRAALF